MKRPWSDFSQVISKTFVPDMMAQARTVSPNDLVDMTSYRKSAAISTLVAYAQDELAYDENGNIVAMPPDQYRQLPRERRLNKFGLAYRRGVPLYLNKILADIIVGAANRLYETQGWTTVIYDGLRTVDGAFNLYNFATDKDIAGGLLALPGQSAHNKGLAVDSMMYDRGGKEVDMGGHFDHLDMESNNRTYGGDKISAAAKKNRLIREAAFLYSAFSQNLMIAPLRTEFWDDRPPENREDLWRVLDSAARCLGISLLTAEDDKMRKTDRATFKAKWESWSYDDFLQQWQQLFKGREAELKEKFGVISPPTKERAEFYHGNYHPIYDDSLRGSGKHLTPAQAAA